MAKRFLVTLSIATLVATLFPLQAKAQSKFFQLSLVTPVQIYPESTPIAGIRLNLLYGRNVSVQGLDVGLVNQTTTGHFKGVQWGLVGIADADFDGFQDNAVNIVKGRMEGFQWGIVNHSVSASGFQLGFVNYAGTMHGLQIGLVNIIGQGGAFPVFPIVNWSF